MGTKIQANAFFREYRSVIDLDGSTSNGIMSSLYNQNQNGPANPADPLCKNSYLIPADKVRETILEHESIFRNQLQELHRLYGRQQELMNEIRRREMNKDSRTLMNCEPMLSKKGTFDIGNRYNTMLSLSSVQMAHRDADALKFNLCFQKTNHPRRVSANSCSNLNLVTEDFFQRSMSNLGLGSERNVGHELISDDSAGRRIFDKHSSVVFPQSLLADPNEEFVNSPLDLNITVSQRKRKLFGVEISGGNDVVSFEASSWIDNSFVKNLGGANANGRSKPDLIGPNFVKEPYTESTDQRKYAKNLDDANSKPTQVSKIAQNHILPADCKNNQENPKTGGLPWFLRNNPQVSNDQNKEKKSCYFMNLDSLQNCSGTFFKNAELTAVVAAPTPQQKNGIDEDDALPETKDHINKELNNYLSEMRYQIDLNLSLDEEDAPSLPKAVVKIATTEIDVEAAPAVIESETDISREDKIAAEAIVAISLSQRKNPVHAAGAWDLSMDRLKCFAEIVSSNTLLEDSIPDGMDCFEYMTLKLEDTKEEVPHYDSTNCVDQSKRSRRGGRQRKDFKRDILPGLVTLSRVEVTEDLQAFDELLKARGDHNLKLGLSQRSSNRNGKGRRRSVGPTISPARKEVCRPPQNQPVCQLEERSLTGWGKRTRRLPRQRCNNNAFLSFAVKC